MFALLLAPLVTPAYAQSCATPAVFAARAGLAPLPHRYALSAPPNVGTPHPIQAGPVPTLGQPNLGQPNLGQPNLGQPNLGQPNLGQPNLGQPNLGQPAGPPPDAKAVYGTPYEHHVETTNFTINWSDADIDPAAATAAGAALETAWTAFLDEQGWTPPVSSDRYLIWVLLDPTLAATGYTAEYYTDDYPQGYPVIWLEPSWASQPAFWSSLAAHEFMHSLQYALRDWDGSDPGEAWYWEASATHASELANPDWDGHQYGSAWYAEQPDLRFDSMDGAHQYGMFVFNAWMEEWLTGPGGMKAVWDASADRPRVTWDTLLGDTTGTPAGEMWADFAGRYGNNGLVESPLYTAVIPAGTLGEGVSATLPYLGTHYYRVSERLEVYAEGDVLLAGPGGQAEPLVVDAGDMLAVTALDDRTDYILHVGPPGDDTAGDTAGDTGPADGDDTGPGDDNEEGAAACGCTTGGAPAGVAFVLAGLLVGRRRR